MNFLPTERTALFIDGANLYSASRNLGFDVDYRNLLEFFRRQAHVIRAYYYSAVLETEEYSPLKPLTDWLGYNGYDPGSAKNARGRPVQSLNRPETAPVSPRGQMEPRPARPAARQTPAEPYEEP